MLDYLAMAALSAVIEKQHFKQAADQLCITQSAISQRIKALEKFYGEPVLIRTLPYRPTRLGSLLLQHFRRTLLLEDMLNDTLLSASYKQRVSIAISRDSLETWFVPVMNELDQLKSIQLDIISDDQDVTLSYLQNGLVSVCASTSNKKMAGFKVEFLGFFDYVLAATPQFQKKYFKDKKVKKNLINAPAINFDNKDRLHAQYLKYYFDLEDTDVQYHIIPSVAGFRQFVLNGYACSLIPKVDILNELKSGQLVELFPDKMWEMPVYWHSSEVETVTYKAFNKLVSRVGRKVLRQAG